MRKQILILASLSCFLCLVVPLLAANGPTDLEKKRQDSLRAFRKTRAATLLQAYPGVKYRIDDESGVPRRISGRLQQGLSKGDPVQTVYEFFEKNRELYGLTDPRSELKVDGVSRNELGTLVVLKQQSRNVEVWNAMLKANFGRDGNLYAIYGSTYPDIDLSITPSIDSGAAIEIAKRDINLPPDYLVRAKKYLDAIGNPCQPISISLSISRFTGEYHLVWIVGINVDYGTGLGAWNYFIDAHSGLVLKKASLSMQEPIEFPSGELQKDTLSVQSKDSTQQPLQRDSLEEKKGPVLPFDTTRSPKELPKQTDSSKMPFVPAPE